MAEQLDVEVDPKACTGTQLCNITAPEVFDYDDDLKASKALRSPVDASEEVWEAVEGCPMEAIVARDADTGEQLFP